jgi:ABC-2 type transport system permease protein
MPLRLAVWTFRGGRGGMAPMFAKAQTWCTVLRICIEERLVYRGDFALGTLMRFLPIVTQIFLWKAIFEAIAAGDAASVTAAESPKIVNYSYHDFIAYYLLTMIARAFSSMPGLASGIAAEIRSGEIKKFLIQPIDLIGFLLVSRVAHKLVYYGVAIGPFALVFFLCRGYFPGWPAPATLVAFAASLAMAFLLGFFLEATLGTLGFWFLEVSSLLFVYMLFNFFFSGHMFPIDMLPGVWRAIVEHLPLKYLAYFPAAVFLGKVEGAELLRELAIELGWIMFFVVAGRVALNRGYRRYSGFGG